MGGRPFEFESGTKSGTRFVFASHHHSAGFPKSGKDNDLKLMDLTGLEPVTSTMSTWRSSQLSYRSIEGIIISPTFEIKWSNHDFPGVPLLRSVLSALHPTELS